MRLVLCLLMLLVAAPIVADEWEVSRVRGEVNQQVSGKWQAIARGDVIADDRLLRTGSDGRIGLSRGAETIELQGDTQIRIKDAGDDLMTSVLQDFGAVSIDVERRNVQHFSVQTPFLAAVVKGTRFTVRSDERGASVDVSRGVVQVQDTINDLVSDIRPGQEATVTTEAPLLVDGMGTKSVWSFEGVPVINGTTTETTMSNSGRGNGNDKAAERSQNNANNRANGNANNAGDNGKANAVRFSKSKGSADVKSDNAGGNGNSNSESSNAGSNGNGNSASDNAGGNGNGKPRG
ncbi:FecR family protein [Devosia sp.]|uniref:FecR family protein n=1 Tax=Devosia sp. TaxID=1871048 RepID=UPI00273639A8|nr:FecR family protein [Devosia sp.]MDP2779885.1 FecR family protein [Devosia sp.]